jgi:hypothetical protein
MFVFWDIETRANDRAREYYERFWTPPGNVTKPETIAAKKEEQLKTLDGAGLRWWTGAVCCICARTDGDDKFSMVNADETFLLNSFFSWCRTREAENDVVYIGKNALDFDRPFCIGRALAGRVILPYKFCDKGNKSPILDIDKIFGWSRSSTQQIGKLRDFAWGLGIDQTSSPGSEVQGLWDKSQHLQIMTHCEQDVMIYSEIYKRWKECTE